MSISAYTFLFLFLTLTQANGSHVGGVMLDCIMHNDCVYEFIQGSTSVCGVSHRDVSAHFQTVYKRGSFYDVLCMLIVDQN